MVIEELWKSTSRRSPVQVIGSKGALNWPPHPGSSVEGKTELMTPPHRPVMVAFGDGYLLDGMSCWPLLGSFCSVLRLRRLRRQISAADVISQFGTKGQKHKPFNRLGIGVS